MKTPAFAKMVLAVYHRSQKPQKRKTNKQKPKPRWSKREDAIILEYTHRPGNWCVEAAKRLPHRNSHSCCERLRTLQGKSQPPAPLWTAEEDAILNKFRIQRIPNWVGAAAKELPGRTKNAIRKRDRKLTRRQSDEMQSNKNR